MSINLTLVNLFSEQNALNAELDRLDDRAAEIQCRLAEIEVEIAQESPNGEDEYGDREYTDSEMRDYHHGRVL